jgi:phage regulator Rha-like protein
MRNNDIVIEFKVRLVKEFYRMREERWIVKNRSVQTQNETLDLDFYTQQSEKIFKLVKIYL